MSEQRAVITVTMPPALREAVEQRAEAEDRPMTSVLRAALRYYLASAKSDREPEPQPAA